MTQEQKIANEAKKYSGFTNHEKIFTLGAQFGYSLRANEERWIAVGMPKDGTVIIRWHTIWNCPIAVKYNRSNICHWEEATKTTKWPEEAFLPDLWQPLPASPSIKLK